MPYALLSIKRHQLVLVIVLMFLLRWPVNLANSGLLQSQVPYIVTITFGWGIVIASLIMTDLSLGRSVVNFIVLGIGSVCTFIYLASVYVRIRSVWVASFAPIVVKNSAAAFSYFVTVQNQLLVNVGLGLAMIIVAVILYRWNMMETFEEYFQPAASNPVVGRTTSVGSIS